MHMNKGTRTRSSTSRKIGKERRRERNCGKEGGGTEIGNHAGTQGLEIPGERLTCRSKGGAQRLGADGRAGI